MVYRDHLLDVFPVGDDDTVEAELAAQDVGQQEPIRVSGDAVHFAGIHHHRHRAGLHTRRKRRQEVLVQRADGDDRRSSIVAARRHAVADVVLQRRGDLRRRGWIGALITAHRCRRHHAGQVWILPERFVQPRPERLPPDIEHRREGPRNARRSRFGCCDATRLEHQPRIPGRRHSERLRKQRRARDVVRAVNGIDAVQHRDL